LQVNMKINKLRETVKAHQEKVTVDLRFIIWSVLVEELDILLPIAWKTKVISFTDI
jgi:hypothetical protein